MRIEKKDNKAVIKIKKEMKIYALCGNCFSDRIGTQLKIGEDKDKKKAAILNLICVECGCMVAQRINMERSD